MAISFSPGPETKDGKPTYLVEGHQPAPTLNEILAQDRAVGRRLGARPAATPDLVDGNGAVRGSTWLDRTSKFLKEKMAECGGLRERRRG